VHHSVARGGAATRRPAARRRWWHLTDGEHHELLTIDHRACEVHARRIRLGRESAGRSHGIHHACPCREFDESGPGHRAEHVHEKW
jgi:hypothetical protein